MASKIEGMRQPDENLLQGDVIKQLPGQNSTNPTSYRSVATMSDEAIASASQGQPDPLRGMAGTVREEQLPAHMRSILDDQAAGLAQGRKPRTISGTADPMLAESGITIGDRVYHSGRKLEGKVVDVSVKSGVRVRLDDQSTSWWNPKHLVKLPDKIATPKKGRK